MSTTPCPFGRQQTSALATMNVRAVVGPDEVIYLSLLPMKEADAKAGAWARFQPRDIGGRFVSYADLWQAMTIEYLWTHEEYDIEDEARAEYLRSAEDDSEGQFDPDTWPWG